MGEKESALFKRKRVWRGEAFHRQLLHVITLRERDGVGQPLASSMIPKKRTRAQDRAVNARRFRGVTFNKQNNRFLCRIWDNEEKKLVHTGFFDKVKKY